MNYFKEMVYQDDPRSIIGLILFMVIGQILMLAGEFMEGLQTNIVLFSLLDLDQYLLMLVHLLSAISFSITIIVGIPKAWRAIQGARKIRRRKRRTP